MSDPAEHLPPKASAQTPRWRTRSFWLQGAITVIFLCVIAALILPRANAIEWSRVGTLLREYSPVTLLAAGAVAVCGHLVYSCFDLLGRAYTHHHLSKPRVMSIAFVSYAFNLNLGSLVGGVGFRYRLYSRMRLKNGVIARVIGMSLVTNWLGYMVLAGTLFLLAPPALPAEWLIGANTLRSLGVVFLLLTLAYLLGCAFSPRRSWSVRGAKLSLPTLQLLPKQFGVAMLNWMLMAGVIFVLLERSIEYPTVLGILLLSSIATVISRVPAGLGVVEAVFVALLGARADEAMLVAALIVYRVMYYLVPLAVAAMVYLRLEIIARHLPTTAGPHSSPSRPPTDSATLPAESAGG